MSSRTHRWSPFWRRSHHRFSFSCEHLSSLWSLCCTNTRLIPKSLAVFLPFPPSIHILWAVLVFSPFFSGLFTFVWCSVSVNNPQWLRLSYVQTQQSRGLLTSHDAASTSVCVYVRKQACPVESLPSLPFSCGLSPLPFIKRYFPSLFSLFHP